MISEVWADLDAQVNLDASVIVNSFQYYGITSRNKADYSIQLRHFIRTTKSVDEVQLDDDQTDQIASAIPTRRSFIQSVEDAILDSEKDLDEHEN